MRKFIGLTFIVCIFVLSKSYASEENSVNENETIQAEIQNELKLAEADLEDDEDLFMDEGSETAGDWSEDETSDEESNNYAEESTTPEPLPQPPVADPTPTPKASAAKLPERKNLAKPTAKAKPAPTKKASPPKASPKKAQKMATAKNRVPASFKQGFKTTSKTCSLHSKPSAGSQVLLNSKSGKKVWLEGHNESWYKGYHKGGHGYFPASCFNH